MIKINMLTNLNGRSNEDILAVLPAIIFDWFWTYLICGKKQASLKGVVQ